MTKQGWILLLLNLKIHHFTMYYTTNIRAAYIFELWRNASTALKFSWDSNHVRILTLNHRAGKKKCSTCYSHMRQSLISDAGVTLRKLWTYLKLWIVVWISFAAVVLYTTESSFYFCALFSSFILFYYIIYFERVEYAFTQTDYLRNIICIAGIWEDF